VAAKLIPCPLARVISPSAKSKPVGLKVAILAAAAPPDAVKKSI